MEALKELPEGCQTLITCRIADYQETGAKIALRGAVTLRPLSDAQIRHYLRDIPDLWAALEGDADLREIARTPLLLNFFADAFRDLPAEAKQLHTLSPGDVRDVIFGRYVEKRYAHEARKAKARREPLPFTLEELTDALGRLALENAGGRYYERNLVDYASAYDLLGTLEDRRAVPALIQALGDEDFSVRMSAQWALRELKDASSVPALIEALRDPRIQAGAAMELVALKDVRALDGLMGVLNDGGREARRSAALALGELGDVRAVEPLIAALERATDMAELFHILDALVAIGAPAIEPLAAHTGDETRLALRIGACLTLLRLDDKRGIDPLMNALSKAQQKLPYQHTDMLRAAKTPAAETFLTHYYHYLFGGKS